MYTIIYSSSVETYLGDIDISSLLYAARQSNTDHKITGILLHINGDFIQVLEGEEETVKKLFEIIKRDIRHKNLKVLLEKEISERQFHGWPMGFKNITEDELDQFPVLQSYIENKNQEETVGIYDFLVGFNNEAECSEAFY